MTTQQSFESMVTAYRSWRWGDNSPLKVW
jgi:hypothetical protein